MPGIQITMAPEAIEVINKFIEATNRFALAVEKMDGLTNRAAQMQEQANKLLDEARHAD